MKQIKVLITNSVFQVLIVSEPIDETHFTQMDLREAHSRPCLCLLIDGKSVAIPQKYLEDKFILIEYL